jgi:RHS repeat-associated protein
VDNPAPRRAPVRQRSPIAREAPFQATGIYTPHIVPTRPSPLVLWDTIQRQDPDDAAARIRSSLSRLARAGGSESVAAYTPPVAWEIEALADGLNNDPKLIYQYVRNHFDYVPTWGLSQSPLDTYLCKMGNAFDLSTLLLALLQAAGFQAEYAFGQVEIPLAQVQNWVGVQDQQALDDAMFWYGGIPGQIDGSTVRMDHVWVRVRVGTTWHPLDPSFKSYAATPGIDLGSALGYNRAAFLAAAEQGAQIRTDYIRDINESNITSRLTEYATNLMDYLRQNAPFAYLSEIVGGREIVPVTVDSLPTQLPYTVVDSLGQSASMPDEHVNKWHFELPGIEFTAYFPDILGERVTLFYYGATQTDRNRIAAAGGIFSVYPAYDVNMKPHLAVAGQVVAVGDAAPLGTGQPVGFSIVSTVFDPGGNPYTYPYQSDDGTLRAGESYAFPLSAPHVPPKALDRHNRTLAQHMAAGEDDESEAVLGQSLHLTGLSWMNEAQAAMLLDNRIAGTVPVPNWQAVLVSQDVEQEWAQVGGQPKVVRVEEASHTIHAPMWNLAFVSASGDEEKARAVHTHTLLRASAAEGAIWEQLQDASAVSMVSLLDRANGEGSKIYHLTPSNLEGVLPELDFPEDFKQSLRSAVAVGWEVFVPEEPLSVDEWFGVGWARYYPGTGGLSTSITGGIGWSSALGVDPSERASGANGGSPTYASRFHPALMGVALSSGPTQAPKPANNNNPKSGKAAGPDVVDTATGAFLYQAQDLAFGVLGHPIRFERFYVSDDHLADGPLGYGWTHSYHLRLVESSDWVRGFGLRSAMDAVGPIAESYVGLDLIAADAQLHQRMVIGCIAAAWALDGLTGNVATVTGSDGLPQQFVELPDGAYRPPGGLFWSLTGHPDGTYTLEGKDGSRIGFDAQGRGSSLTDANGNETILTYDGQGHLIRVTDAVGRSIELSYSDGHLTAIDDPAGRTFGYAYDGDGNLVGYTDAREGTISYAYDDLHRVTSVIDPEGLTVVENTYDELGRTTQQIDGRGGTTRFRYGDVRTTVTDPLRSDTLYHFDRYRRLVGKQDALGHTTSTAFDASDNTVSFTDARGGTSSFSYDTRGNLTQLTDALSFTTLLAYDAQDNLTRVTDALGRTTDFAYDAHRNPTAITDALGGLTTLSYDTKGQVTALTDANGHTTTYGYDAQGNLTRVTDPLGHASVLGYDSLGRLVSHRDPSGGVTSLDYDNGDNVVSTTDPLGHQTTYSYDGNGLLTQITDARGHATHYGYDGQFNLTRVTDPLGQVTRYGYDANDHLTRITDANGHVTRYERDGLGQLTRISDPLGRATEFAYDPNGNVLTKTKADGNAIHYTYDANDRVTHVSYPDGSAISQEYDGVGNLTGSSYSGWQAEVQHDALDRPVRRDLPGEDVAITYVYDAVGNPLSIEARRESELLYQVEHDYDAADRLTEVVDTLGDQTIHYAYDANGRVTAIDCASGAQTTYRYDANGRATQVNNRDGDGSTMSAWTYVYDEVDNPLEVTRTTPGGSLLTSYGYDALDRLVRESYPRYTIEYAYDAVGNRTLTTSPLGTVAYAYDAADQLLSAGAADFTHDANGNRTSRTDGRGTITYRYDYRDRLVQVTTPGGAVTSYRYDAAGRRVGEAGPGGERWFVYDGLAVILEGGTGPSHGTAYVYGNDLLVASRPHDPESGSMAVAYHGDGLGSVANLSDGTGRPRGAFSHDAFGRAQGAAANGASPYRFLGQQGVRAEEAVDDLYLMGFRTYDPSTGRFLTQDPIPGETLSPGSLHQYSYALNNPLGFVDPLGLRPEKRRTIVDFALQRFLDKQQGATDLEKTFAFFTLSKLDQALMARTRAVLDTMLPAARAIGDPGQRRTAVQRAHRVLLTNPYLKISQRAQKYRVAYDRLLTRVGTAGSPEERKKLAARARVVRILAETHSAYAAVWRDRAASLGYRIPDD